MAAIELSGKLFAFLRWNLRGRTSGLAAGAGSAVILAFAAFLVRGGDMNAARFATSLVLIGVVPSLCHLLHCRPGLAPDPGQCAPGVGERAICARPMPLPAWRGSIFCLW